MKSTAIDTSLNILYKTSEIRKFISRTGRTNIECSLIKNHPPTNNKKNPNGIKNNNTK